MSMLRNKLLWKICCAVGLFLGMPALVLAQGTPDIIWKRPVITDRVNNVLFTPDGQTLISGGSDRLINFWRVSDGALMQTLNTNAPFVHESAIEWLSLTADAKLLASCSYQIVQLWELPSGATRTLTGHTDWVVSVGFSPNGSLLASASFDGTVRIWRVSDGTTVKILNIPGLQRCAAFSPDGTLLAAASGDNNVYIYRTSDWALLETLTTHTDDLFTCAFSPDGTMLATGGYDDTVRLWNVADWSLRFTFAGNSGNVYGLAFTHDNTRIGFTDGEGHTIKIYRTSDGALLRTYTEETEHVQTVAFSKDGLLGYGRIDSTVILARTDFSSSLPATPRITSPANGATFAPPANITITASPSTNASNISKMEFFQNGIKLGEDVTSPFSFLWNDVAAGTYSLTVVDTDNLGATKSSAPITITVASQTSAPPSITITGPKEDASFAAPANITIAANASAAAGVANVEFFQNGISLGQDAQSAFTMAWTSVPIGNYSLTAVVTDKNGATAASAPVNITVTEAPPETILPRVRIASPAAGARLMNRDVILSGTASDNIGVAQVLYSLNSEPFTPANGTLNWEAFLSLVPGPNVVQVKSVDTSGNESPIVSRTFTYVLSGPLTLQINGSGKVSPLKDAQILEIGKTYSIAATPERDFIFSGWTGSIITNAAKFSFVMVQDMNMMANFVPNPFALTKGNYFGLIQSPTPNHEGTGFFQISVNGSGTLSGKFSLGGNKYSLKGKFDGNGLFTGRYSRSGLIIGLQLDLTGGSDQVTGTISGETANSTIVADRSIFDARNNPAPDAGQYTILIPANSAVPNSAQGNGFGILKVDAAGKTRAAGSLADGTRFSQSAGISKTATWPFHVLLYRGQGSVFGTMTFRNQPGVSDLDGTMNWIRPAIAGAKLFADGFFTQTTLLGSRYTKPAGAPVLAVPETEENLMVNLGNGDLNSELQKSATLKANNQIIIPQSNEEKLRVTVSASSGALRGSFVHPVTGRATKHNGVVFQKQNLAEGYFLGAGQSGFISVVPADGDRQTEDNPDEILPPEDEPDEVIPPPDPEPIPEPAPPKKKKGGD